VKDSDDFFLVEAPVASGRLEPWDHFFFGIRPHCAVTDANDFRHFWKRNIFHVSKSSKISDLMCPESERFAFLAFAFAFFQTGSGIEKLVIKCCFLFFIQDAKS
jgi:hypothetical protein